MTRPSVTKTLERLAQTRDGLAVGELIVFWQEAWGPPSRDVMRQYLHLHWPHQSEEWADGVVTEALLHAEIWRTDRGHF